MRQYIIQGVVSAICTLAALIILETLDPSDPFATVYATTVALLIGAVLYIFLWLILTKTVAGKSLFPGYRLEGTWIQVIRKPLPNYKHEFIFCRLNITYDPFYNRIKMSGKTFNAYGIEITEWQSRVGGCEEIANDIRVSYIYTESENATKPREIEYAAASFKVEEHNGRHKYEQGFGSYQSSSDAGTTRKMLVIRMRPEIQKLIEAIKDIDSYTEAQELIKSIASYYQPGGLRALEALALNQTKQMQHLFNE